MNAGGVDKACESEVICVCLGKVANGVVTGRHIPKN